MTVRMTTHMQVCVFWNFMKASSFKIFFCAWLLCVVIMWAMIAFLLPRAVIGGCGYMSDYIRENMVCDMWGIQARMRMHGPWPRPVGRYAHQDIAKHAITLEMLVTYKWLHLNGKRTKVKLCGLVFSNLMFCVISSAMRLRKVLQRASDDCLKTLIGS